MEIKKITDPQILDIALETLNKGGLVVYPTETCYGIGANAENPEAVNKVLEYKERPSGKAISIAVNSKQEAEKFVEINNTANNLYDNFLPGPVTIVSKSKGNVDKRLESENGTLGIRIPNHSFLLNLLTQYGKPITATSANLAGKKTPYNIKDILDNISQKQKELIDLVIDAGELPHNLPSTVIDTTSEDMTVYREGRIDPSKIETIGVYNSNNDEQTVEIGKNIISNLKEELKDNYVAILLNGELGAGKTHLTKGIAEELGIGQVIKSPTYNYVYEYKFHSRSSTNDENGILYHLDAWRIQSKDTLKLLNFEDWFKKGNVIVIEWPSVVINYLYEFFSEIGFIYIDFTNTSDNSRKIKVHKVKPRSIMV